MKILFDFLPIALFFGMFKYAEGHKEWAAAVGTQWLGFIVSGGAVGPTEAPVLLATVVVIVATLAQIVWLLARGKKIEDVLDAFARIAGQCFELQFARFDARVVENIAGELDERSGARVDGLGKIALLVGERSTEEEVGEADDAVEWRADLVAHRGKELALGPIAGLRLVAGVA